jgi:hypothetical protein
MGPTGTDEASNGNEKGARFRSHVSQPLAVLL